MKERPIALLGIDSAGKSSILEWLKLYYPLKRTPSIDRPTTLEKISPTVGLNVAKLRTPNDALLVWDLGGAVSLRPIWERYVQEAEALIWVVDSSDHARLDESRDVLKPLVARPNLQKSPLLVLANKQDKDEAVDPVKISLALDLLPDSELRPQCIQPCSADTGEGIKEGVEWLLSSLQGDAKHGMRIP